MKTKEKFFSLYCFTLLLLFVAVGCYPPSLQESGTPTFSIDVGKTSTSVSTQIPTEQLVTPGGNPTNQFTIDPGNTVLTIARSDSLVDSTLFFDQDLKLVGAIPNVRYPILSSLDCNLLSITDNNNGFVITTRDGFGNIHNKVGALEKRNLDDRIYNFSISPSEQWLTYLVITGDWGMSYADAEIQNIRLLKIDSETPQNAQPLTLRGGARPDLVVWSPDGDYLAYTDFDQEGKFQVFLFDLQRSTTSQVTHFEGEVENEWIITIKWAFGSDYLAIATSADVDKHGDEIHAGAVHLLRLDDGSLQKLDLNASAIQDVTLWWGDNQQLLIFLEVHEDTNLKSNYALIWFDIERKEIKRMLTQTDLKADFLYLVLPLSDNLNLLVFPGYSAQDAGIYNFETDVFTQKKQELFFGLYEFVTTSSGLLRSPGCKE